MRVSQVISRLEAIFEENGDVECFTNGEYGIEDSKVLAGEYISVGPAHLNINTEYLPVEDDQIIVHIGGY